jgi:peptidoglycan hydrolase CwlO-like protein
MKHHPTTSCLALTAILLLIVISPVSADTRRHTRDDVTGHVPSTHEEILSHRARKKEVFGEKLDEIQKKMDDHKNGINLMNKLDYERTERKIKAYKHKLEELNREFDERHSRRLIAREELLNEMTRSRMASRDEL